MLAEFCGDLALDEGLWREGERKSTGELPVRLECTFDGCDARGFVRGGHGVVFEA